MNVTNHLVVWRRLLDGMLSNIHFHMLMLDGAMTSFVNLQKGFVRTGN